ncbi:MAG: galactosyltransferase-related protein [Pseudomonadota bacterium]
MRAQQPRAATREGVSVMTLVRGRDVQLRRMLAGLAQQTEPPSDCVVAWMEEPGLVQMEGAAFPVKNVAVLDPGLPLALARNSAANAAHGDVLVFLDVDCIPCPGLVSAYAEAVRETGGCVMGPARYLKANSPVDETDFETLWSGALRHPARLDPDDVDVSERVDAGGGLIRFDDFAELWGLSFALPAKAFHEIGGFDATFEGYGGEETDFAVRLGGSGLPLSWTPAARAVHQWHPVHAPPLQHFDDIVRNACRFFEKHGHWPMTYWLGQFAEAGYIRRGTDAIEVLKHPTDADIAAARQPDSVAFS